MEEILRLISLLFILSLLLSGLVFVTDSGTVEGVGRIAINANNVRRYEINTTNMISNSILSDNNNTISKVKENNTIIEPKINRLKLDSEIADQYRRLQITSDVISNISKSLSLWVQAIHLGISDPSGYSNERLVKSIQSKNIELISKTIQFKSDEAQRALRLFNKVQINHLDVSQINSIIKYQHESLEYYKRAYTYLELFVNTNLQSDFQNYIDNEKLGHDKVLEAYNLSEKGYSKYYNELQAS